MCYREFSPHLMKRIAVVLALLPALLVVVALPVRAGSVFDWFGGGLGHGVGLSQYGAYGLALDGWSSEQIFRHFYRGTRVQERDPPKSSFRVGLLEDRAQVHLKAAAGAFDLTLSDGTQIETVPDEATRRVKITGTRKYLIFDENDERVGGGTLGSASTHLRANPQDGARVVVQEWGHPVNRGRVEFKISGDRRAHVVAVVGSEPYLFGIAEVPSSWPDSALQAQVIAARSYAYNRVANPRTDCACDIYSSVRDQFYVGWDKEGGTAGDRWRDAVRATDRQVGTHDGGIIQAFYSSSSGGFTENSENVFIQALPYLRGVCDPGDYVSANPNRTWHVTLTAQEVTDRLGLGVGTVERFENFRRGVSGRVLNVRVVGSNGSTEISGQALKSRLGLKEVRVWVNENLLVEGRIRDEYDSLSCKPGLATSRRKNVDGGRVQVFEEGRIYENTATNVTVWLRGAILGKYLNLGGPGSFLGLPRSYRNISPRAGRRATFDGGHIYSSRDTAAHELHGAVLDAYVEAGRGDLGYPITDLRSRDNGLKLAKFEGGKILCPDGEACRVVLS